MSPHRPLDHVIAPRPLVHGIAVVLATNPVISKFITVNAQVSLPTFFSSTYDVGRWVYAWMRIQRKLTFAWHTRLESLSSYVHTICSIEDVVVKIPHPLGRCWPTAEFARSVSFVYLGQRR
ncbi:hypothetical protein M422DRAFT_247570 [Sphaerobolus stellatus SS14]|nr:hypothetical protein M422DRAFT_247570 [Sphaerobolus stellatus SS14]